MDFSFTRLLFVSYLTILGILLHFSKIVISLCQNFLITKANVIILNPGKEISCLMGRQRSEVMFQLNQQKV